MSRYTFRHGAPRVHSTARRFVWLLVLIAVIAGFGALIARQQYVAALRPVSTDQTTQLFTVREGSSVKAISAQLQKDHLIRSSLALQLYVHARQIGNRLQAGTYALSPNESTQAIVSTLTKGNVSTKLVTILPGQRIDQVRAGLINDGFAPADVDQALNPAQYANVPVLAFKPIGVNTLEGLLWPDSFQKDATTSATTIITQSLQEMGRHLTTDVQGAFAVEGLSPYQGLILTSVITKEVDKPSDQSQVAQVFLSRLKIGMMMGSDVTANYGSIAAGHQPNLNFDSPYNTLIHKGLPPTPISTITANALNAATHPASTNWIYFVAGDDGTTYFSTNLQDHQALTAKYCHKLCGR